MTLVCSVPNNLSSIDSYRHAREAFQKIAAAVSLIEKGERVDNFSLYESAFKNLAYSAAMAKAENRMYPKLAEANRKLEEAVGRLALRVERASVRAAQEPGAFLDLQIQKIRDWGLTGVNRTADIGSAAVGAAWPAGAAVIKAVDGWTWRKTMWTMIGVGSVSALIKTPVEAVKTIGGTAITLVGALPVFGRVSNAVVAGTANVVQNLMDTGEGASTVLDYGAIALGTGLDLVRRPIDSVLNFGASILSSSSLGEAGEKTSAFLENAAETGSCFLGRLLDNREIGNGDIAFCLTGESWDAYARRQSNNLPDNLLSSLAYGGYIYSLYSSVMGEGLGVIYRIATGAPVPGIAPPVVPTALQQKVAWAALVAIGANLLRNEFVGSYIEKTLTWAGDHHLGSAAFGIGLPLAAAATGCGLPVQLGLSVLGTTLPYLVSASSSFSEFLFGARGSAPVFVDGKEVLSPEDERWVSSTIASAENSVPDVGRFALFALVLEIIMMRTYRAL